jgi:hypothetical protein
MGEICQNDTRKIPFEKGFGQGKRRPEERPGRCGHVGTGSRGIPCSGAELPDADAETLYREALQARREVLGLRHPDTLRAPLLQQGGLLLDPRTRKSALLHLQIEVVDRYLGSTGHGREMPF